jgi:hypothetical protein
MEFMNTEYYKSHKNELSETNLKKLFYESTRFNEINSYEIAFACFEIAIIQGIKFSINNLINAFNVVNPKQKVPIKDELDDVTLKLINDYKDQTEIYVLIELTQAHHYFDYTPYFNPHRKVWLKPKVVEHIIKKFEDQSS